MADGFVKKGKSRKDRLNEELHKLEAEIEALGTAVSDSQIWHKRARIDAIKKEIRALDTGQFNVASEKLKARMEQQRNVGPDEIAAMGSGRE